jgi:protein-tyrosine phosphatase
VIDLHCHILPGLDDGPVDAADSLAMARQADADGVTAICATPHIRHDHDVRIHELPDRLADLGTALRAAGCAVRVLPGGEVAETIVLHLDDDELRAVTLGGAGRWILLEPRPGPLTDGLTDVVHHLADRGFRSLLAHPERHLSRDIVDRLVALTRDGVLVQATAAYFVHGSTVSGMHALASAGVVHVLGSDAHSSRIGRPVVLSEGIGRLADVPLLAPHLEWVARTAPAAIVAGEDVVPPYAPRPG